MSANVTRTGNMPYPNTRRERFLGGHAVMLVGYNKNKNVFIARNSWGKVWGDKGYFYMPFDVVRNTRMSSDFWIIKEVNNP
jgi:C1A family cysteine protease